MDLSFDDEDILGGVDMYDPRDAPTSQRAWTRRRPHHGIRSSHSWTRPDFESPDMMRDYPLYGHDPHGFSSRIEELGEFDETPQSLKGIQSRQGSYLRQGLQAQSVSFSQAARAMHAALVCADQECRSIEASFVLQMREVESWLPLSYVNSLWTVRLSWDGRPQQHMIASDTNARPKSTNLITYDGISQRFNAALLAMKTCSPPDRTSISNTQGATISLGWEVLGSTMRKLQISIEAIEDLLVRLKTQRGRMPLLLHEIASAQHLLESVREVWQSPNSAGKRADTGVSPSSPPAASSSTQGRRGEYAWPRSNAMNERYDDIGIEI